MRRIGIIIGSESDLPQCKSGLVFLAETSNVEVPFVDVASIHRNTKVVLGKLEQLHEAPPWQSVDALIVGAGWANHLSGMVDAYLRYELGNASITVYAVAFEDAKDNMHTQAARMSIIHVPGTKMIFRDYVGAIGFLRACQDAAKDALASIKLPKPRAPVSYTLFSAQGHIPLIIRKQKEVEDVK